MTTDNNRFGLELGLGKHQDYQDTYNPTLLQPIARTLCRQHLPMQTFLGVDIWTGYELSWLDPTGKPQVAIAEFSVPATSANIIESKSFKYYLNSFNQTQLSQEQLLNHLREDLSKTAGAEVGITLYSMESYQQLTYQQPKSNQAEFSCVDSLPLNTPRYQPDASLLHAYQDENSNDIVGNQILCSHLLKSNCPVTGQPDWASVWVSIEGKALSQEAFLAYIVSYRGHQDFHENCVEQIYCDIWQTLKPTALWVYARYTRRGGLDINPFRASHSHFVPPALKAARQ